MKLPSIPQLTSVSPLILLTGFLGAGKTTLLRHLLETAHHAGLKSDVILNDYADARMDSATLKFTNSLEPLSATCACCEGLDFLLDIAMKSSKADSDLLFVELNGTADPVPIIESFTLLENKLQLHPRWQICVIDLRYFGERGSCHDIEKLQLQTASHIYLTHENENTCRDSVIEALKKVNPYAAILDKNSLGESVIELSQHKKTRLHIDQHKDSSFDLNLVRKSKQHQRSHEFHSCQILMPDFANEQVIRDWLAMLPKQVLRVKLLIGVFERGNHRYLFERVGNSVSKYTQRVRLGENVPNSAILIGPDLPIEQLSESAQEFFYTESS